MQLKVVHRTAGSPRSRARWGRRVTMALLAAALSVGCVRKPARSEVASGNRFEAGEPSYDEFFKSLYDLQLTMGHAPDREQAVRQGLVKVADAPPTATNDDLSAALDKRLDAFGKTGVSVKVSVTGLDGDDPTAHVVKSGAPTGADAEALTSLEDAVRDAVALLLDLRHSKPELERLKEALPPLDPKVDTAFKDASSRKRREIRDNLTDAGKLIPLMVAREAEVDGKVVDLFHALEKVSPPAIAAPPPAEAPPPKKKKEKKGAQAKNGAGPEKTKSGETPESKPAKEPAPPAAPSKPSKPKPAEDFEP